MSLRVHEFLDEQHVYGADVTAPGIDFGLCSQVGLLVSEVSPGSGDMFVWAQAKIGPVWFDIPLDWSQKTVETNATAPPIAVNVRNAGGSGNYLDEQFAALCKHCPFDELRIVSKQLATGDNATITATGVGK